MRLSRTCYDKAHRCPGWAGGGTKGASVYRCKNGSIRTGEIRIEVEGGRRVVYGGHPAENKWQFGRCTDCDVVTWPVITRWLDPGWWGWQFKFWKWDIEAWLDNNRREK